jgi:hypothetical protein
MDETQQPDRIAAEAVGERLGSDPPDAVRHPEISQEEAAWRLARAPGPRASIAEKSAEAMGERISDAYANPGRDVSWTGGTMDRLLAIGRDTAQSISRQLEEQPVIMVFAGVAVGYLAGALIHSRR